MFDRGPRGGPGSSCGHVRACVERARRAWPEGPAATGFTALYPDDIGRFQSAQHRMLLDWLPRLAREGEAD
jgi:hypothetical protein